MKRPAILKSFILLTAVSAMIACGDGNRMNNENQAGTADAAEEKNEAKFDGERQDDAEFLEKAAIMNLQEVQLGNLALERSKSQSVKDLARMIVDDHQKSYNEISALASQKGISVASSLTDDDQRDYRKLMDEKADDFDKKWTDLMVEKHKDAVDKHEKAAKNVEDPQIREWAAGKVGALRNHLDMAMNSHENAKTAADATR